MLIFRAICSYPCFTARKIIPKARVLVRTTQMKTILRMTLILSLFTGSACAFSLLGPYATWMQSTNGFRQPDDIGGPMNLGEEYRWNVPVLTYAFDQSFLDYFGPKGVAAVEQAIQILNDLPPVSQLDPANYPAEVTQVNYQAQALNLTDVRSKTLAVLLEQLGLAQPTRHSFDVYSFYFMNGNAVVQTVGRNFDPLTFGFTNWVNDTGYNYVLNTVTNGPAISVTAEEFLLDPLTTPMTAVADDAAGMGDYYTGLTRDDVGGLRYLLHTNNLNLEILLPGVQGIGPNASAYANQALRRGVDKITLVRRDYDGFLGQFFTPYTNQFTDHYISNSTVMAQQLERVVSEPDILFSMGDGTSGNTSPIQITRSGTSNWWNSATLMGAAGPGLIRPPIKLMLSPSVTYATTSDLWPDSTADYVEQHWASYDGSTNSPVIYPVGNGGSDVILNLKLVRDNVVIGRISWQIPLASQESVVVETSGNLVDWVPYLVLSAGKQVEWTHHCAIRQRYFRIVPQD